MTSSEKLDIRWLMTEQVPDRVILRKVRVGDHIVTNVTAFVNPPAGDLLLGQSFLSKFGAVTVDYKRLVLILSRRPPSILCKGPALTFEFPVEQEEPRILVPAGQGGGGAPNVTALGRLTAG
jgi:hypothetical protein